RDGRLDVASINVLQDPKTFKTLPGTVSVLLGRADGTFAPARRSPVAADNAPLLSGDFNGDGRLDLATIYGRDPADSGVVVLLGLGDGSFAPAQRFAAEGYGWYLVSGDFNGDGHLDLATASDRTQYDDTTFNALPNASVLLGLGDGKFAPAQQFLLGGGSFEGYVYGPYNFGGLLSGDYNGDGRSDLAASIDNFDPV